MHLIHSQGVGQHTPFYQKHCLLTRANSLPYIFQKLRIHRNLTKKALAQKFGVSEEYISKVESGSVFPTLKFCLMCGDFFGANPNWVKNKWANERISRFSQSLRRRLDIE